MLPIDGSLSLDAGPSNSSYTLNSDVIVATFQNIGLKTIGIVRNSTLTSLDGYVLISQVRLNLF